MFSIFVVVVVVVVGGRGGGGGRGTHGNYIKHTQTLNVYMGYGNVLTG